MRAFAKMTVALTAMVSCGSVANSAVQYNFTDLAGISSFNYTSDDYITSNTTVSASDANCSLFLATCNTVSFSFGSAGVTISLNGSFFGFPAKDSVVFSADSLSTEGLHFGLFNPAAFLAVNQIGGAVPEPASWAMMVGGFGLLGAATRRRRAATIRFA